MGLQELVPVGHRLPSRVRRQLSEIEQEALVVVEQMAAGQLLHQTGIFFDSYTHRLAEILGRTDPILASRFLYYEDSQTATNLMLIGRWASRQ